MKRLFSVLFYLALAASFLPVRAESVCEWALKKSEALESSLHPRIQLSLSQRTKDSLFSRGISEEELEVLIQKSPVNSLWMNGEMILPLFRTVRDQETYRDYVFAARLRAPFVAGRPGRVHVLQLSKVSERGQKPIFNEIALQKSIRSFRLRLRHKASESAAFGFAPGPITVKISPAVIAKLRFKHKIDLNLLRATLDQYPDEMLPSPRKEGSVEVYYHSEGVGDDVSLILILARDDKTNTTSLVTSYFMRRTLH